MYKTTSRFLSHVGQPGLVSPRSEESYKNSHQIIKATVRKKLKKPKNVDTDLKAGDIVSGKVLFMDKTGVVFGIGNDTTGILALRTISLHFNRKLKHPNEVFTLGQRIQLKIDRYATVLHQQKNHRFLTFPEMEDSGLKPLSKKSKIRAAKKLREAKNIAESDQLILSPSDLKM